MLALVSSAALLFLRTVATFFRLFVNSLPFSYTSKSLLSEGVKIATIFVEVYSRLLLSLATLIALFKSVTSSYFVGHSFPLVLV